MLAITLATILVASTLSSASPTLLSSSNPSQKRAASVVNFQRNIGQTENKVFNVEAAQKERARIQGKYGKKNWRPPVSPGVAKRALKTVSKPFDIKERSGSKEGKNPLTEDFNRIDVYYGPISVGTPPQETTVEFDTTSSDLVVPLSTCQGGCTGPLFDSSKSTTFKGSKTPFSINYPDASRDGTIATDTVTVAGLTVAKQAFGAIDSQSKGFSGPQPGLMGLGFPDNAATGSTPFFINLAESGALASNVFSFYMSRGGADGSELCLGCVNSDKYTGDIDYYSLDPSATKGTQLVWNIPSTGIVYESSQTITSAPNLSNAAAVHTKATGFSAVIDSGASLIFLTPAVAKELYSQIPNASPAPKEVGAGFYVFPCSFTGTVSLGFGGKHYPINPKDFILGPVKEGSSECVGAAIADDHVGDNFAIIGDVFMKNWYSVFDYDRLAVGFAKAK